VPKGYVIVLLDVADLEAYAEYARRATETEHRHGGRAIVAADADEILEGPGPPEWTSSRVSSIDAACFWYADPRYQAIVPIRRAAAETRMVLIEGLG
jgi:uncharacterized protein (DUF1330 family)